HHPEIGQGSQLLELVVVDGRREDHGHQAEGHEHGLALQVEVGINPEDLLFCLGGGIDHDHSEQGDTDGGSQQHHVQVLEEPAPPCCDRGGRPPAWPAASSSWLCAPCAWPSSSRWPGSRHASAERSAGAWSDLFSCALPCCAPRRGPRREPTPWPSPCPALSE